MYSACLSVVRVDTSMKTVKASKVGNSPDYSKHTLCTCIYVLAKLDVVCDIKCAYKWIYFKCSKSLYLGAEEVNPGPIPRYQCTVCLGLRWCYIILMVVGRG